MKNFMPDSLKPLLPKTLNSTRFSLAGIMGAFSIALGVLLFVDPAFEHIEWYAVMIALTGFMFLIQGLRLKVSGFVITGTIALFLCIAFLITTRTFTLLSTLQKIGAGLIAIGITWLAILVIVYFSHKRTAWWILLPCLASISSGYGLIFSSLHWTSLVFWPLVGIAGAFLIWAVGAKLPGLAIAGSLVFSTALGILIGWRDYTGGLALKSIGIMLVIFSFGWGLIILFWKLIKGRSIWWPLIPAGVLVFAGWGLVIGGSPGTALTFITNTSSIMLIILGIYLLLLRGSLNKK